METFNFISAIVGLISGIWAIADPNNGPLGFFSRLKIKFSNKPIIALDKPKKLDKPVQAKKKLQIEVHSIWRHLFLITISYSILSAALFLTSLYIKRNSPEFDNSPYFPSSIFDLKAAISYYEASSHNQRINENLGLFESIKTGFKPLSGTIPVNFVFGFMSLCLPLFSMLNAFYLKGGRFYYRILNAYFIVICELLILAAFATGIILVMSVLNFFIKIDLFYWSFLKMFCTYGTFYTAPIVMYWVKVRKKKLPGISTE